MVSQKNIKTLFLTLLLFASTRAFASHVIDINQLKMPNAPDWLIEARVQKVVDAIGDRLQWDIRKINVKWYSDQAEFEKMHGFGPTVLAFSLKKDMTVTVGPHVDTTNFDQVFGHELVHIISYQKYKGAIPAWLKEGLANYLSKHGTIDYIWLASQPRPDVHLMSHPFKSAVQSPRYQYMASTALAEMIDKKCGLDDMLGLSVGASLEPYLATTCEMPDINKAFDEWLKLKSNSGAGGGVKSKP